MWELGDPELPDEPGIARAERTGLKPGELPFDPDEEAVNCPVCGAECDTVYRKLDGEIVGCDVCVYPVDAYDWKNAEKTEWGME